MNAAKCISDIPGIVLDCESFRALVKESFDAYRLIVDRKKTTRGFTILLTVLFIGIIVEGVVGEDFGVLGRYLHVSRTGRQNTRHRGGLKVTRGAGGCGRGTAQFPETPVARRGNRRRRSRRSSRLCAVPRLANGGTVVGAVIVVTIEARRG